MKNLIKSIVLLHFLIFVFGQETLAQNNKLEEQKTIAALINQFTNQDAFVSGEAIAEVVKIGEPSVEQLIKSLSNENETVRWCAAIALGKIAPAGQQAIPFLAAALKDENLNVRWCSAIALGKFQSLAKSSVTELQNLLNDKDEDVRWAAYTSLCKIDKDALNKVPKFSDIIEKLETLTPQLMKELKVPGVSISVIKNNKITWSKSYGAADAEKRTKVSAETIFEACSMSKPVFAFLVLMLVDEGKLDLDKPLYNYLEEEFVSDEADYSKQITARIILSHTSGMPNWRKGDEERGAPIPIYFKPGTRFNYSGEGIYYLQRVVEHITNEPLESYAKRNLFDKLDFKSTSFVWTENLNPQISTGHDTSGNCNKRIKYTHSNAAYTLYTTADEYAKFIIEIMNSNKSADFSLSQKMTNEMLTHQVRVDVRDVTNRPGRYNGLFAYRGLGWAIDSTITNDVIYHSGANQTGFRCYSQFNIKDLSGIVIMTNGVNGSELWQKLISVIGDL